MDALKAMIWSDDHDEAVECIHDNMILFVWLTFPPKKCNSLTMNKLSDSIAF